MKVALALPASSFRRRLGKDLLAQAFEALAREDYDVILLTYDPNVEINVVGAQAAGFAEQYHGHNGYRDLMRVWGAEWQSPRYKPEALFDLGDRWIIRMGVSGRGRTSGVELGQTVGYVLAWRDGAIVRMDVYWDWTDCRDALGLGSSASSTVATRRG